MFRDHNPGYKISKKTQRVVALKDTKTVNFGELMRVLKSAPGPLSIHHEAENGILDGQRRFFDGEILPAGQRIAYTTFPRSGNTCLRKYLELITGIETGANMPLPPVTMQQMFGMRGENITDERVWVVKTHYPMNMPNSINFNSNKVIVCVRNPLDAFHSLFTLRNTFSHSAKLPFDVDKEFPDFWDTCVKGMSNKHQQYFDILFDDLVDKKLNPVYFLRFEDLIADPAKELDGVMRFLMAEPTLDGMIVQKRIADIVAKGPEASETYKTKATTRQANS